MNESANAVYEVIRALATAAGTGYAVLKTMDWLKIGLPRLWAKLSTDARFWLAVLLSFLYPLGAYAFMTLAIIGVPLTWEGILSAFAVGYAASQYFYKQRSDALDAIEKAAQDAQVKADMAAEQKGAN